MRIRGLGIRGRSEPGCHFQVRSLVPYSWMVGERGGAREGWKYRIKDIDQRFIDEKGLEQNRRDGRSFSQHQHGGVEPGQVTLKDGEERYLGEIGEDEEERDDGQREDDAW